MCCALGVFCCYQHDPIIHSCAYWTEVDVACGAGDSSTVRCFVTTDAADPVADRHLLGVTPGVCAVLLDL
uniref:Uncharacterized protein n=1 Tax=Rubus yellow net virus TaxID=198310 RepID=A0A8F8SYX4_9VIRU|nr:hypothetical protein [Rubus yellow net virus]